MPMKIIIKGEINQPLNEYDYEELMMRLSEIGIHEIEIKTKEIESLDISDRDIYYKAVNDLGGKK